MVFIFQRQWDIFSDVIIFKFFLFSESNTHEDHSDPNNAGKDINETSVTLTELHGN